MSPLNRGPLLSSRIPPVGMRPPPPLPPPPRFGRLPMPSMPPRMPLPPHTIGAMYRGIRPRMPPPRVGSIMRPGVPPPLFAARNRGPPPLMLPMMGPRGMGPRGPLMRPGPRGILPPQVLPHMRPRFPPNNTNIKTKIINNSKKVSKLEELELKKPWMTDEIRSEIQKKNKLYAKAKKNKDAKEWEEFKDLRNKVTRMIRDAKNEYLAKNPESAALYQDEPDYFDERDENNEESNDEETSYYCEMCDREFFNEKLLYDHNQTHKVCGIDGCAFTAHPKLIEKHISMQHRTGLYHKIKNLSTAEDIEKWINERKRKYPTKSCIEMKKAESLEKQQRGEIVKTCKSLSISNNNKKNTKVRNRKSKRSRPLRAQKINVQSEVNLYRGIQPFMGTGNLYAEEDLCETTEVYSNNDEFIADDGIQISDEEEQELSTTAPIPMLNTIGSLVADYSSDLDDDEPEEVPIKKLKVEEESTDLKSDRDTCAISNNCSQIERNEIRANDENKEQSLKKASKYEVNVTSSAKSNELPKKNNKQQKRLMLLQQLLSRSIIHERNYICQCIKYIEDNNFFIYDKTLTV